VPHLPLQKDLRNTPRSCEIAHTMRRFALFTVLFGIGCDDEPKPLPACLNDTICLSQCLIDYSGNWLAAASNCPDQCHPLESSYVFDAFSEIADAYSLADTYLCVQAASPEDMCENWLMRGRPGISAWHSATKRCLEEVQGIR
jgi:hypothetical protein